MSSVSRRESHTPASTDLLVPAGESHGTSSQASAGAPARTGRSTGRQETPAGAVQNNQVETYRGPVERPRARTPGGLPAGTEGGGGLTAGQLALGGAKVADAARADAAYADIQATLHTDWKDWAVTDADVRRVHEHLEKLPPADYRRMMERMEQGGLLGKYAKQMSPEAREEFLAQAGRKGYVTHEPGKKAESAPCQPPDGPALYLNDAKLPGSVRQLVHETNREAKKAYDDAHHAYVRRYSEQVMQAKDLPAIRDMGEPVAPFPVSEPGVTASHPDHSSFRSSWARVPSHDTRSQAYKAVSDRCRDLADAQRAGTLKLKQETEISVESEGMTLKMSRETSLTQYGKTGSSSKVGAELEREGLKGSVERESSGAVKTVKGVDLKVAAMSFDSEGTLRMEVSVPGTSYGAYSEVNPGQGTFGGGVSVKKDFRGVDTKTEYGVTMQGSRPERAHDVASMTPGTLFGPLPELAQGLAWEDLPAERRARMERDGWTAGSWASQLQTQSIRR
ncbi:hypothetical protein NR798_26425 [Archangium gephyra]|uniref:hypothetical protein n=1 Tax=Archangium gephyra TaxID=48 RepID=UPI0035D4F2A8